MSYEILEFSYHDESQWFTDDGIPEITCNKVNSESGRELPSIKIEVEFITLLTLSLLNSLYQDPTCLFNHRKKDDVVRFSSNELNHPSLHSTLPNSSFYRRRLDTESS